MLGSVVELQPFGNAPGHGRREGLVKRRHPARVQIVENQPNHRDTVVGLIPSHRIW